MHRTALAFLSMVVPFIEFSGFILTEIYVVQPFTNIVLAGTPSGSTARIRYISKYFSIFREGLQALKLVYQELEVTGQRFVIAGVASPILQTGV